MIFKNELLNRYPALAEGTKVRSRDDENLGTVLQLEDDYFVIEKGIFFPKDFFVRYDQVEDVRDGTIYLSLSKDELAEWKGPEYEGWRDIEDVNAGRRSAEPRTEFKERYPAREEVRVPVSEEELEAQKKVREKEGVAIRKIVHTEYKHFTVPVMKEEIRVERTPVREERAAGAEAFKEGTVNIPVREEEVEVTKRPVVKEEVRVSKEQRVTEKEVGGLTRKEEVKVDQKKKKTA